MMQSASKDARPKEGLASAAKARGGIHFGVQRLSMHAARGLSNIFDTAICHRVRICCI